MKWTDNEREMYRQVGNIRLDEIYTNAGISESDPEERFRYLAQEVLGLNMTDHDLIVRTANEKGKPAALNLLEEMTVARINDSDN